MLGPASAETTTLDGNPFIGMFAECNDKFVVVGLSASEKFRAMCGRTLHAEVVAVSIADSSLIGTFSAMNSRGIVVPEITHRDEVRLLKSRLGVDVAIVKGNYNAIGHNVLANDRGCIVNPDFSASDVRLVRDALDVEVIRSDIAGRKTVGSVAVVTDRGLVVLPDISEKALAELEEVFKVRGAVGTANLGVPFLGLSLVANSSGYVAGALTSGYELARIEEGLGFL